MDPQNRRFMTLVRALRGTPEAALAKELLHALRRERQFRRQIEALRRHQSQHLYKEAKELCRLRHEQRGDNGDR